MKVLLISGVYPPHIGGPSLQTQQIAQTLVKRGIEVQVAAYGDRSRSNNDDGFLVTFLDGQPYPSLIRKIWRNVQVYQDLKHLIQSFQPTVIHMQTAAGNLAILAGILSKQYRIPSLIKYTADLAWEKRNENKLSIQSVISSYPLLLRLVEYLSILVLELTQRILLSLYDYIWATTPLFKDKLINQFHIPRQKILLCPNFVDLHSFQQIAANRLVSNRRSLVYASKSLSCEPVNQLPNPLMVLTIARLRPWKGIDQCIQAMSYLTDLPVRLKIVGDGTEKYQNYLHQLAEQLGVSDRIEFVGAIPPKQIAEIYRTADLFVLASQYEPFGIVLLEAMAAGVPIIASNVDGIPFVVEDGISAQLFSPGDSHRLAAAIRTLFLHPEQRIALATAASERVKQFDLDQGIDTLIKIYEDLFSYSSKAALGTRSANE